MEHAIWVGSMPSQWARYGSESRFVLYYQCRDGSVATASVGDRALARETPDDKLQDRDVIHVKRQFDIDITVLVVRWNNVARACVCIVGPPR